MYNNQDVTIDDVLVTLNQKPADYIIYKKKGALQASLKKGKVNLDQDSSIPKGFTIKGCVFLTFANAVGTRDYDWENRAAIALNEHEIGDLILALEHGKPAEFYHDKNLNNENRGKYVKNVKIKKSDDGKVLFANCYITREKEKTQMNTVPISANEAAALATLLRAALPKVLGWS